MLLVDTGYFLALADPRDQHHARAAAWSKTVRETLAVTEYVLVEIVNGMSYPRARDPAHDIVQAVRLKRQFTYLPASAELLEAGLDLHRRSHDKEWSLTDCISFHVMRERGITRALAYDHHFAQAGFEPLLR